RARHEAPDDVHGERLDAGGHAGADEERADVEGGVRLGGEEDLRVRDGGEPDEQESCGERETRAAQSRTGKNSRATCSSSGSFFLITSYSRSVSCMDPSACMLTWPSSEKSGLEILCAASTASGLQPI